MNKPRNKTAYTPPALYTVQTGGLNLLTTSPTQIETKDESEGVITGEEGFLSDKKEETSHPIWQY